MLVGRGVGAEVGRFVGVELGCAVKVEVAVGVGVQVSAKNSSLGGHPAPPHFAGEISSHHTEYF